MSEFASHIRTSLAALDPSSTVSAKTFAGVLGYIADVISTQAAEQAKQIQELGGRVEQLERHGIKYAGTWQRAMDYTRGMVTTHKGSGWIAVVNATRAEPGDGPDWQLMVKAGRDAR